MSQAQLYYYLRATLHHCLIYNQQTNYQTRKPLALKLLLTGDQKKDSQLLISIICPLKSPTAKITLKLCMCSLSLVIFQDLTPSVSISIPTCTRRC